MKKFFTTAFWKMLWQPGHYLAISLILSTGVLLFLSALAFALFVWGVVNSKTQIGIPTAMWIMIPAVSIAIITAANLAFAGRRVHKEIMRNLTGHQKTVIEERWLS